MYNLHFYHLDDRLIISKDPDGLSGSMKPRWFEVLLSKYNLFVAQLEAKGDIRHLKVTSGKFACFLGLCVFGQIGCNEQEKDAIFEVSTWCPKGMLRLERMLYE